MFSRTIQFVKNLIQNFFLQIEINTLNLPYWKLPKPHPSSIFSLMGRKIFERKWIRGLVGFNLATAMLVVPLVSDINPGLISANNGQENYTIAIPADPEPSVVTKPRKFLIPVDQLRYIGQWYHPGHPGYDLDSVVGASVRAFTSGRVVKVEYSLLGYGKHILVDHGDGLSSLYAHLGEFKVKEGDVVEAGQEIGLVGMTGWTTGPHLHFEIHDNGVAINPRTYLGF